jgi:hypothetical protein
MSKNKKDKKQSVAVFPIGVPVPQKKGKKR